MRELIFTSIKNNPTFEGLASVIPDVVFSTKRGLDIKMQIISPQAPMRPDADDRRYPCIVFVQGSAWTFPDLNYEIPQMSEFARNGYVVDMVTHRSSLDGHRAPAFLEDVKTAIRFLRANADKYRIDTGRIGIWGTSSGGNTALLVGLTGDDPGYVTDEYPEYSDRVKTVVDCFGPADVKGLFASRAGDFQNNVAINERMKGLLSEDPQEQQLRMGRMNPAEKVRQGVEYPPFLLIHGDRDDVVPYEQSENMARLLCRNDVHTELIRVEGAEHEGTFWSRELLGLIADYFARTL